MPKTIRTGEMYYVSKCEFCEKTFNSPSIKTLNAKERLHYKLIHKANPIFLTKPNDFLAEEMEINEKTSMIAADIKQIFSNQYLFTPEQK